MSEALPLSDDSLPLTLELQIDAVCQAFEAKWKSVRAGGDRPRIEDHLGAVAEPEHGLLLRELLKVELHYRREERPTPDEYRRRFPEQEALLGMILDQLPDNTGDTANSAARPEAGHNPNSTAHGLAQEEPAKRFPKPATGDGPTDIAAGASEAATTNIGRYTGLEPFAHGGLGEVFTANDTELHRVVAVKRLQDRHAGHAGNQRRFLLEAEITARLEHPGVVPVHGMFRDDCGRPCYAMRFIAGQTLADALRDYHAGLPDPVAFRRLLQCFIHVCQTVAYGHSRGVIHRDLKPQNIMLGKFGETLVLDWGLAKVVGRPPDVRSTSAEATLQPLGSGSGAETEMGSAMGTPAYMSPEQAAGRWDVIQAASDVYGLGAVLYTLLTGRPPFEGKNWPELQQRIQRGDFPRPRAIKPALPRALEAICLRAMKLHPEDRYPSAQALAAEVERWLADEPVQTFGAPVSERLGRWARRHKPMVAGMLALLITAVIALWINTVLVSQEHARRQGAEHEYLKAIENDKGFLTTITNQGKKLEAYELLRAACRNYAREHEDFRKLVPELDEEANTNPK
jgi:eukaryotic-like serine/threonine-protein kinase